MSPRCWVCLVTVAIALPSWAWAQPSVAELRRDLEALRRERPDAVPVGTLEGIAYQIDVAERIAARRFETQSDAWRARAQQFLERARAGTDPYPEQRGRIVNRGYVSPISKIRQGYAIYLPRNYDPSRAWPLMIVLHGGSSNGNLFLGVVLGNNMDWLTYSQHLWDDYTPRWSPDWIVVAPDGYGQVMWRWMGEQDVLDVLDDVTRHYHVDADQVVLGGLSNGGVGAHNIGMRHAWRFSTVMAMAGAPSWLDYAGGRPRDDEELIMSALSARELSENAYNTEYRIYHGRSDTGPMRPRYIETYEQYLRQQRHPHRMFWFDLGHDILYPAHRHGRIYEQLAPVRRNSRPREVRVVTGDYRANRQHWVTVTRIRSYPELARVRAVVDGSTITLETSNATEIALDLRTAPVEGNEIAIVADGAEAWRGSRTHLGHVARIARVGERWRLGVLRDEGRRVKRPGLSGPITDAYHGRMVHVYGTARPGNVEALRRSAERGSRGWPVWLWNVQQEVVADTAVDDAMMRSAHLVLYGTPGDNRVLDRIAAQLPFQVDVAGGAIAAGTHRFSGRDAGVKYVYPNPLAPGRYVIVQTGINLAAVDGGHNLPDFVPDFVVYDQQTTRTRQRLIAGRGRALWAGFFDAEWNLPSDGNQDQPEPGDAPTADPSVPQLPIPPAPPPPTPPATFLAPPNDPAGRVAREIARRVPTFTNFRAQIPGATWILDPIAVWQIRPQRQCLQAMRRAGVRGRLLPPMPTPVPTPVEITGPVRGVWFRSVHEDRTIQVSCELAVRLPDLVEVLRRHDVRGVDVLSSYREQPRPSFHTMGLALDIPRFWTSNGVLSVLRDYHPTPMQHTCEGPEPGEPRARALRRIACDLAATRKFNSVLTPNYNEGHRDHLHLDTRPDDPRVFVR